MRVEEKKGWRFLRRRRRRTKNWIFASFACRKDGWLMMEKKKKKKKKKKSMSFKDRNWQ
jgi:hypothetical protein